MIKRHDISRLQPIFIQIVTNYSVRNNLNQTDLADIVQIQRSHVNALLNNNRKLTTYYLLPFVFHGIIKLQDIQDEESKNEKKSWELLKIFERASVLKKIDKLYRIGINVEAILDHILASKKTRMEEKIERLYSKGINVETILDNILV